MPLVDCGACGGVTKPSMLSKSQWYLGAQEGRKFKSGCYARVENERWVKGCLYGDANEDPVMMIKADALIKTGDESNPIQVLPGLVVRFALGGVWLHFEGVRYKGSIHLDDLAEKENGTSVGLAIQDWIRRMKSAGVWFVDSD